MPLFLDFLSVTLLALVPFMTFTDASGYLLKRIFQIQCIPPKEKPQKPKGKEEKAPPVEKLTVDDLFRQFEKNPPDDMAPSSKLWEIFNTFFLQHSDKLGLISLKSLALAGDGTPVYTSAQFFADDRHRIEPI